MRKREAGWITKQKAEPTEPTPIARDRTSLADVDSDSGNLGDSLEFRHVIPPGQIGSMEDRDLMNPIDNRTIAQQVYTKPYERDETRPQQLHGSLRADEADFAKGMPPFQSYATFDPRQAPMPRAAQDSMFLRGPGLNVADPRMTDDDASVAVWVERGAPDTLDIYAKNRAGMPHNENKKVHPGFAAVQGKIQKEGYSKQAAGAILASASRNASKAAHKANPRLSKVKG